MIFWPYGPAEASVTVVSSCVCDTVSGVQVTSSSPAVVIEEKEVSLSFVRYVVRVVRPHGSLTASVSVSSASSAQVLLIPVSVMHLVASSSSVQGLFFSICLTA